MRTKIISCVICTLMIVVILVIKLPNDVNAQVTEEWVRRYNGPKNYLDSASDLAIGPSGKIYVTGTSYGNGTGTDYDTVAYDPDGNLLWSARYHGTGNWGDGAFAITTDRSENVYVTGTSHSATNHYDIITISYDSFGNERWIARYNGPTQNNFERAFVITTDSSGNVYVAGESSGIRTDNYVTIKYDSFGNEAWVARYNGSETSTSHRAWAIAVDNSENVYVSGEGWYGTWGGAVVKYDSFGNEVWVRTYDVGGVYGGQGLAVDSSGNVFVYAGSTTMKYDSDGNVIWSTAYTGPGIGWLIGTSLELDRIGNVYVSGYGKGLGANDDYVTVKYDQDGNELWWVSYNGPGNNLDRALDMVLDAFGNVYVAGRSTGSNGFDDCATVAYDLNGNELWVARYNGPGNRRDGLSGIAIDSIGNIYVTGQSDASPSQRSYVTIKYSQQSPNQLPIADAGLNQTVNEDDLVHFSALSSNDPNGTIESYQWDFDARDGLWWETGAIPDSTDPTPTHIYGDNGVYIATLKVTNNDNLTATDTCNITVINIDPLATIESVTLDVEIGLRVAGRKFNDVGMTLFEDDNSIGYVSIERIPGSPNDQIAWIPISIDFSKSYTAAVTYIPEDPPNIGANPVWIYIKSQNGGIKKIHHTFNVQQSKKRDSDHWNHIESWRIDLSSNFIGLPFEITSHISDPGSDDEYLTYTYGSQIVNVTYLNNPPNLDPYSSPEYNPRDIIDMTFLIYEGIGTVTLVVKDDDNVRLGIGEGSDSMDIK